MKNVTLKKLCIAAAFLAAFALWTGATCLIDVQEIGPHGTSVGFATVNGCFHKLTGVHMALYTLTDWLSLVPIALVLCFALLGAAQWVWRKRFFAVDYSILVLGGFYLVVAAAYVLFEICAINYRPVLIEGALEASYPSSTTVLVMCVMPTAMLQLRTRIAKRTPRRLVNGLLGLFTVFMVFARVLSGVHWLSDIIGGALLSAGLVMMYDFISSLKHK